MTTKERVRQLLDRLPDDCSIEEVLYGLRVLLMIERRLVGGEAGRRSPQALLWRSALG